jgi:hypothetical protein
MAPSVITWRAEEVKAGPLLWSLKPRDGQEQSRAQMNSKLRPSNNIANHQWIPMKNLKPYIHSLTYTTSYTHRQPESRGDDNERYTQHWVPQRTQATTHQWGKNGSMLDTDNEEIYKREWIVLCVARKSHFVMLRVLRKGRWRAASCS